MRPVDTTRGRTMLKIRILEREKILDIRGPEMLALAGKIWRKKRSRN